MTSRISHMSVDALDAYAQSVFWSEVLDFTEDPDDPNEPGDEECLIMSRDRSQLLLFITVPDGKTVKNRVHLDLRPDDRTREQETGRILALGASQQADHRRLMAAAGSRSPILKATSSASCPGNQPAPEPRPDSRASHFASRQMRALPVSGGLVYSCSLCAHQSADTEVRSVLLRAHAAAVLGGHDGG